jgi:hypothetical protein
MTMNRNKFPSAFAVCPSRQLWRIARRGSGKSSLVALGARKPPEFIGPAPGGPTGSSLSSATARHSPRDPRLQCLHPMPDPPPRFVNGQDDNISHSFTDPSPRYSIESTF